MKVLQIIHGYPMRYNAGSEVYTQGLAQVLAERHEVHVFTREENALLPEYAVRKTPTRQNQESPFTSSTWRGPGTATGTGPLTRASPKSHWAWPGAWDNGTNISLT